MVQILDFRVTETTEILQDFPLLELRGHFRHSVKVGKHLADGVTKACKAESDWESVSVVICYDKLFP